MAEPTTINCSGSCTVTLVHEFSIPPFQLDVEGGAQIAGAILAVWALGFCFRALIQTLKSGGISNPESDS